jgi:transposase-like protein
MSVRDIAQHLSDLYGTEIGRATISRVTDAVLEDIAAWRTRPLEAVYPIVYFDSLMVKVREDRSVRTRACYLAIGVSVEGERDVLGIWWQETEGAEFWLAVRRPALARRPGRADLLRRRARRLPRGDRGRLPPRPGCRPASSTKSARRCATSPTATARPSPATSSPSTGPSTPTPPGRRSRVRPDLGERYPMIADSWRARWEYITPFLALPADLRWAVYTTNSIENLNRQIRKAIKTRGHFPDEQAATKPIYLAIQRAETKWRTAYNWTTALRGLKIHFGDRLPD